MRCSRPPTMRNSWPRRQDTDDAKGKNRLRTQVIQVPYDSGQKDVGMGRGPARLLKQGWGLLKDAAVDRIEVKEFPFEAGTTFQLLRSLSKKVTAAVEDNSFPLVLAGGCISCLGVLGGLRRGPVGMVWIDAHGDFNTPETTLSGFLDGMALAAATGRCWRNLTASVEGFRPVKEKNVVLIGARDLDSEERKLLESSEISWVPAATMRESGVENALSGTLARLEPKLIYLHIDLDVLDAGEASVNRFSSAGGLTVAELLQAVRVISSGRSVVAAAITAYDPLYDADGKAAAAGAALMNELNCTAHSR